jgi:putative NADH-flavin reductase
MTTIAVIGATGTVGSRVVSRLKDRAVGVVQIALTYGVDVITGNGLSEALQGVDVVIDVSNPSRETITPRSRTPSPRPPATWWAHAPGTESNAWWC